MNESALRLKLCKQLISFLDFKIDIFGGRLTIEIKDLLTLNPMQTVTSLHSRPKEDPVEMRAGCK